jgi:hypothetical protein
MEGQRISKIGLAGYPGYIFLQKIRYGYGKQRYDEKRTILHNWYSALRSHLPVLYHADDESDRYKTKKEEYTKIKLLLDDVSKEIATARKLYKPTFENPERYDPLESEFEEVLEGIQERLDVITANTHIIDKARSDGDEDDIPAG